MSAKRKYIASGDVEPSGGLVPEGYDGAVFWYDPTRSPAMRSPHRHPEWELNLVVAGRAEYLIDHRRVRLGRDALLWLLPGQPHRLLGASERMRMWVVVFAPRLIRRLSRDPEAAAWRRWLRTGRPSSSSPRVVAEGPSRRLQDLCEALRCEAMGPAASSAALGYLASSAWRAYGEAKDVPQGTHLHPSVEFAAHWLADHAHRPEANDLEALAQKAGVSRSHLSRMFADQTGRTITSYRRDQRVRRMLALIGRGGRHSLTEAAYAAGFGSYAQAYRAVRESTGLGLRDWLQHTREGEA
ncbi:MAG: AraC family transcriptional regulator [Planctomycetota bacterium]